MGDADARGGCLVQDGDRARRRRERMEEQMRLSAPSALGDLVSRIAAAARKGAGVRLSPREANWLRKYHVTVAEDYPPDELFNSAETPGGRPGP